MLANVTASTINPAVGEQRSSTFSASSIPSAFLASLTDTPAIRNTKIIHLTKVSNPPMMPGVGVNLAPEAALSRPKSNAAFPEKARDNHCWILLQGWNIALRGH